MEPNSSNENATVALDAPPKLVRSVEEQALEAYLDENIRTLEAARANVDIAERLYDYGLDDEEMAIGMGLYEAAKEAVRGYRGAAAVDPTATENALAAKIADAREKFVTFRGIARAAFTGLTDRLNLRLVGEPPDDLQRFITSAHTAYMSGAQSPYTEKLTKRGYPDTKLGGYLEELDALAKMGEQQAEREAEQEEASADASAEEGPTASRDETYLAFKEFMKEFKGIARTVFRDEPEQLQKLGLKRA